jgi:hypothetical protein
MPIVLGEPSNLMCQEFVRTLPGGGQQIVTVGGDDHHETAAVFRVHPALQVVGLFQPGDQTGHRGLADLLAPGEVAHPQRAMSLNGG